MGVGGRSPEESILVEIQALAVHFVIDVNQLAKFIQPALVFIMSVEK